MTKLNLGGGNSKRDGYANLDIYLFDHVDLVYDIEKRLPFENDTIDEIYCSHALEHCSMEAVPLMLKDWCRVLKRNGVAQIIVPEINACMKNFLETSETNPTKWSWKIEYILGGQHTQVGQQLHKSAFTVDRLRSLMEVNGFMVDSIRIINNGRNDCIHLDAHKI